MNKKHIKIIASTILFILVFCFAFSALAHSGRTDSSGGHYDRSTGEYHYHHGYPAHDHIGGVCPYDYDDKTGVNSGGSSGSSNNNSYKSTKVITEYKTPEYLAWLQFAVFALSIIALSSISAYLIQRKKNKKIKDEFSEYKLKYNYGTEYKLNKCIKELQIENSSIKSKVKTLCEKEVNRRKIIGDVSAIRISETINAPKGALVDRNGYPHIKAAHNKDLCTVYTSSRNTNVMHKDKGCSGAKTMRSITQCHDARGCTKCFKDVPDMKWFEEYKEAMRIARECNLPVVDDLMDVSYKPKKYKTNTWKE